MPDYTYTPDSHARSLTMGGQPTQLTWANLYAATSPQTTVHSGSIFIQQTTEYKFAGMQVYLVGFYTGTLVGVTAAKIRIYVNLVLNTMTGSSPSVAWKKGVPAGTPDIIPNNDWKNFIGQPDITDSKTLASMSAGNWYEFPITDLGALTPDANGYVWFYCVDNYTATNTPPPDMPAGWGWFRLDFYGRGIADDPDLRIQLVVTIPGTPDVTTNAATSISTTSATMNGTLNNDNGLETTCSYEYGTTVALGSVTSGVIKTSGQTFPISVTDLLVGTTYHFRAKAVNAGGTSYGVILSFELQGAVYPESAITRVTAIIHRYVRATQTYTMEVSLGGVTSDFGMPEWADKPRYVIPPPQKKEAPLVEVAPHISLGAPFPPAPPPTSSTIYRCPYDGETFSSLLEFGNHVLSRHSEGA